jgi:hypothetical protein
MYLDFKLESKTGLYKTSFDDGFVIWKALNFHDFKKYRDSKMLLGTSVDLALEEKIFKDCVLFSSYEIEAPVGLETDFEKSLWLEKHKEELKAGIVSTVVRSILQVSGVTEGAEILNQLDLHRDYINNIEDQIILKICQAFPAYKPEDVEAMDWQTILKRAAQAETILGYYFEIDDPEARAREAEKKQRLNLDKEIREVNKAITGSSEATEEERRASEEWKAEQRRKKQEYLKSRGRG